MAPKGLADLTSWMKKSRVKPRRNSVMPNMKVLIVHSLYRRWLQGSTAGNNEFSMLKLSGNWAPQTVHALRDYVRCWSPTIVFLTETKAKLKHMEKIKFKLDFSNGLIVPSSGRSGGLALLWSKEVMLEIKSFSKNHIDAIITESPESFSWHFTGFYGHLETHMRGES